MFCCVANNSPTDEMPTVAELPMEDNQESTTTIASVADDVNKTDKCDMDFLGSIDDDMRQGFDVKCTQMPNDENDNTLELVATFHKRCAFETTMFVPPVALASMSDVYGLSISVRRKGQAGPWEDLFQTEWYRPESDFDGDGHSDGSHTHGENESENGNENENACIRTVYVDDANSCVGWALKFSFSPLDASRMRATPCYERAIGLKILDERMDRVDYVDSAWREQLAFVHTGALVTDPSCGIIASLRSEDSAYWKSLFENLSSYGVFDEVFSALNDECSPKAQMLAYCFLLILTQRSTADADALKSPLLEFLVPRMHTCPFSRSLICALLDRTDISSVIPTLLSGDELGRTLLELVKESEFEVSRSLALSNFVTRDTITCEGYEGDSPDAFFDETNTSEGLEASGSSLTLRLVFPVCISRVDVVPLKDAGSLSVELLAPVIPFENTNRKSLHVAQREDVSTPFVASEVVISTKDDSPLRLSHVRLIGCPALSHPWQTVVSCMPFCQSSHIDILEACPVSRVLPLLSMVKHTCADDVLPSLEKVAVGAVGRRGMLADKKVHVDGSIGGNGLSSQGPSVVSFDVRSGVAAVIFRAAIADDADKDLPCNLVFKVEADDITLWESSGIGSGCLPFIFLRTAGMQCLRFSITSAEPVPFSSWGEVHVPCVWDNLTFVAPTEEKLRKKFEVLSHTWELQEEDDTSLAAIHPVQVKRDTVESLTLYGHFPKDPSQDKPTVHIKFSRWAKVHVEEGERVDDTEAHVRTPSLGAGLWTLSSSVDGGKTWGARTRRLFVPRDDVAIAVNCGGGSYISTDGVFYEADRNFRGGYASNTSYPIHGTCDVELYRTYRIGYGDEWAGYDDINYEFELDGGDYVVTLKFAEIFLGSKDDNKKFHRLVNVVVNDDIVESEMNLAMTHGVLRAYDREVTIHVPEPSGKLHLLIHGVSHDSVRSQAIVNAICVTMGHAGTGEGATGVLSSAPVFENQAVKAMALHRVPLVRSLERDVVSNAGNSENLLVNPSGAKGRDGWEIIEDGGDGWVTRTGGYGTEFCFCTSFGWCRRKQSVDLVAKGFSEAYLDTAPRIHAGEWIKPGVCGGGEYELRVSLLDKDHNEIKSEFSHVPTVEGTWHEIGWDFKDYGAGVRFILFEDGGKDDKFWKGHYGTIMGPAEVTIELDRKSSRDKATTAPEPETSVVDDALKAGSTKHNLGKRVRRSNDKREVRLFCSSTFRDMLPERDQLVKYAFHNLKSLCAKRGVFFTDVDLRWGITSEQSGAGEVVSICLKEIDKSRPYFICFLGERYGWCQPEKGQDDLLAKSFALAKNKYTELAWVEQYKDRSVTELEVLYGVLNDTTQREHARFYFRDPKVCDEIPEDRRSDYQAESEHHKRRLNDLKERIEASGCTIRKYATPAELANLVLEDMTQIIERDYPTRELPTSLEKERLAHDAFAEFRSRVYVGREEYFKILDDHLGSSTTRPLVLLGEPGSGKSALLANWTTRLDKTLEDDVLIITHFIGSSIESANHFSLMRRVMLEIKSFLSLPNEVAVDPASVTKEFPIYLQIASNRCKKVVLVLDALNQLENFENAHALAWLPQSYYKNIRVVVSTLKGACFDALQKRRYPYAHVKPLTVDERKDIIVKYLQLYGKTLNSELVDQIANAKCAKSPLFVRSVLEELRQCAVFENLSPLCDYYVQAETVPDFFSKMLARLETDFEFVREEDGETINTRGMVKAIMTSLWAARRGMSEDELLSLIGQPRSRVALLFQALQEFLVSRSGLLNFFHDHFRFAVRDRYLSEENAQRDIHRKLAEYFNAQPLDTRKVEELPHQLAAAHDRDELSAVLLDVQFFLRLYNPAQKFDLIQYWRETQKMSEMPSLYESRLSDLESSGELDPSDIALAFDRVARFLQELGFNEISQKLFTRLLSLTQSGTAAVSSETLEAESQNADVLEVSTLNNLGRVSASGQNYDEAISYYEKALALQRKALLPQEMWNLITTYYGLGATYNDKGVRDAAGIYLRYALEMSIELLGSEHIETAVGMDHLAILAYYSENYAEAEELFTKELVIVKDEYGPNHPDVATVLNNLALLHEQLGRYGEALREYQTALDLFEKAYGESDPKVGTVSFNIGCLHLACFDPRAVTNFQRAEEIYAASFGKGSPSTQAASAALKAAQDLNLSE